MKHCSQCQLLFPDHAQLCPDDGTPLRVVEDVGPGMIIRNKYRIVAKIGSGGMASVFRARHELLNENRAIKLVLPKYANDKDFLKRFRHEAAVARKLRHPNAVSVEDLDQIEDGRPFMVMELLQGLDLRTLILKEGPLSVERTLALASQIASALSAAHGLGIVHRDIKPDNIFITVGANGKETAKVLDFGIAKAFDGVIEGMGYTATKTGMMVGTPQYISPEQAMGQTGNRVDGRADIYSLAVVIYEMLTGRLPFESDTPMGMVLHHLNTKPQPPHELHPELHIPPAVSLMLMQMLEKDPAKRFQTAKELVEALKRPSDWAASQYNLDNLAANAPTKIAAATTAAVARAPSRATVPAGVVRPAAKPVKTEESSARTISRKSSTGKRRGLWIVAPALLLVLVVGFFVFQYQNSDDRLRTQVLQQFSSSSIASLQSGAVQVEVMKGVATLEGRVSTDQEKTSAGDLARAVSGIKNVVNRIEIRSLLPTQLQPAHAETTSAQNSASQTSSQPTPMPKDRSKTQNASIVPAITNQVNALTASARNAALRKALDLANSQRDGGHYRDAIKTYNEVLRLDPSNTEAKAGLAKAQQAAEWEVSN